MGTKLKGNSFFVGSTLAIGLLVFAVSPGSAVYKITNTLFFCGMLLVFVGLTRLLRKLGLGGLFAFSWGRMRHVIRSKKDVTSSSFPNTYFDYVTMMKDKQYSIRIPFICGSAFVLVSFILSFAIESIL